MDIDTLTSKVIGCAYAVHNTLGQGFLEKVYENAFCVELVSEGLEARQQHPVPVMYRGKMVGDFYADLIVENRLIVELKAVAAIKSEHEVQLVNYLTATGIENGLLINFGTSVEIKRKFRHYQPKQD